MKDIFSLVKVTYDYFRYEDLLYVGTMEEIENILLKEKPLFVKQYGLKDKKMLESEEEPHYWIYNRSFDGIKVKVKNYEELIILENFTEELSKEKTGLYDALIFGDLSFPKFMIGKDIKVIKVYNEYKKYFDYEDLKTGHFLKKEWIKEVI